MLVEAIHYILANDPGVQAALGVPGRSDNKDGVFFVMAPSQVNFPYVVFQQIGGSTIKIYEGVSALKFATFQFSCYAASALTAHKTALAVKNALDGILGDFPNGGSPVAYTRIEGAWLEAERDTIETELKATTFGVLLDYTLCFVEAG
jgi:hypothetical protein